MRIAFQWYAPKNCTEQCRILKETIRPFKANTHDIVAKIASDLALFLDWRSCVGVEYPLVGGGVGTL
jgi:hypothetical protein